MSRAFVEPVFVDAPIAKRDGPLSGAAPSTAEAFEAALLAVPRFIEGSPPCSSFEQACAGRVEARRWHAAARAQGGNPDQVGVATRPGEALSQIEIEAPT